MSYAIVCRFRALLMVVLSCAVVVLVASAAAQNALTIVLRGPTVFGDGERLSLPLFLFGFEGGTAVTLQNATLTGTLPAGFAFLSTSVGSATVSGTSATGQQVTVQVGTTYASPVPVTLVVASDGSLPAGTPAAATFQATGNSADVPNTVFSPPLGVPLQSGYLPVSVSFRPPMGGCVGSVEQSAFPFTTLDDATDSPQDGSSAAVNVGGFPLAALATGFGRTNALTGAFDTTTNTVQLGEISNAFVRLRFQHSALANAQGGFLLPTTQPPAAVNTRVDCSRAGGGIAVLHFSNPNAYFVELNIDARYNFFAAASDTAAGFPGVAEKGGAGSGFFTGSLFPGEDPAAGVETFQQSFYTLYNTGPAGNTASVTQSIACFPEGQATCAAHPPIDSTIPFTSSGHGYLVAPGENDDFIFPAQAAASAFGDSQVEPFESESGNGIIIRTGYGTASVEASVTMALGNADLTGLATTTPAVLDRKSVV